MKNSSIQLAFTVLVLVIGAGLEEILPKVLGVGFPVLLCAVQFSASRRPMHVAALFALAAGAVEDALSSLVPMTSGSYFLVVAAFARFSGLPRASALLTYPCYQLWLAVWGGGGVFARTALAFPIGLVTAFAVSGAIAWAGRKAAVDELG